LSLPGDIAVVWGPNSKGKTSLGEAFEFLLTGRISRREMMASSQDEFADALRNAHLATDGEVYVTAQITAPDGSGHEIKRVLTADYAKRQDCASRLEIDGAEAQEADLTALGIALSQPPLQAPVLAQHTLGYIFSVKPQDRATYFKALFEVTDLDELRNVIAGLGAELEAPTDEALKKFEACAAVPLLRAALSGISRAIPNLKTVVEKLDECVRALLEDTGAAVPLLPDERRTALANLLTELRSNTFPVRGFERQAIAGWNQPAGRLWSQLQTYMQEKEKVDEETRQLSALFGEALKLPAVEKIAEPADCPLCGADSALTPARVQVIRQHVEDTSGFKKAESDAKAALGQLSSSVGALVDSIAAALPGFLRVKAGRRRQEGFRIVRIRQLLGDGNASVVDPWLAKVRPLMRAASALKRGSLAVREAIEQAANLTAAKIDSEGLEKAFQELTELRASYADALDFYDAVAQAVVTALNKILDEKSDTAGWQDLLDIVSNPKNLRSLLIERNARAAVAKELETGLKQIDSAKEKVLEDKFADYSGSIQAWWERLRPDESTFFSAVQPRKGAKRTIDFKAGLSATSDRNGAKLRDVIAIFSQSQLHCLGLALFLARAEHDGAGFIVLDDPVLSSDEDYRVHFNSTVLSELIALPIQVIVLTQDHDTWEELETRYRHVGISTAQLFIEAPADGTIIENTSDALLAKINRAKSLARGGHPDLRKECGIQLRDAGERFCKEILVNDRRQKGEMVASLTDYDGKTMEWLFPKMEHLLDRDASHPGKFTVFKNTVNNACHDNSPPNSAAMTQAHGEIRFLVKEYLDR
jgi:hypothetical protein